MPERRDQSAAPVGVARRVPGLGLARHYRRAWLRGDVVAGIVLVTLLVPQGMAYAELAGLPPVTGLYTTVVALTAYAVFGPSRILVLGPDSALGPLIAAAILPLRRSQRRPGQGGRARGHAGAADRGVVHRRRASLASASSPSSSRSPCAPAS